MDIIKKEILDKTKEDFTELTSGIEDGIRSLKIIGSKVSEKTFVIKTRKSQLIVFLYSDMVETIEAAYNLCLQGHYECVAKLLRNAFECSFVMRKLNSYKNNSFDDLDSIIDDVEIKKYKKKDLSENDVENFEIRLWLDNKLDKDGDPEKEKIWLYSSIFSTSKLISKFSDMEKEDKKAYHKLSQFVHPSFSGIISRLQIKEGHVKFSSSYKKEFAERLLKDIFKTIVLSANTIRDIFPDLAFSEAESDLLNKSGDMYEKLV